VASPVARLGDRAVLCVVRLAEGEGEPELNALVADLAEVYAPVEQLALRWSATRVRGRLAVVMAVAGDPDPPGALPVLFGTAVGLAGLASDEEIAAAAADPTGAARSLLGRWVVVAPLDDGLRIVTSSGLAHTMKTVTGATRTAWATAGLAALRAARVTPQLAADRVPEFVAFDYVLHDDELLDGVRVLPEASVVDVRAARVTETSYWSVTERFAPGEPSTPGRLRDVATAEIGRLAGTDELMLALTGGKDSRLMADCLDAAGGRAEAFTMGDMRSPDVTGARAVADALGWPHVAVSATSDGPRADWSRAVAVTRWTEGMWVLRDLVGRPGRWPFAGTATTLWGSGGETGRAFYWAGQPATDPAGGVSSPRWPMPEAARRDWTERVGAAVATACAEAGGDLLRGLDVLYARGRMRKWLSRTLPHSNHALTVFTSPAVTSALLDLPDAQRRSGAGFVEALRLGRLGPPPPPPPVRKPPWDALLTRVRRWRRAGRPEPTTAPVLAAMSAPEVTLGILGRDWWAQVELASRRNPSYTRLLWNALAVEALVTSMDALPALPDR
jgi:hypothetical protein